MNKRPSFCMINIIFLICFFWKTLRGLSRFAYIFVSKVVYATQQAGLEPNVTRFEEIAFSLQDGVGDKGYTHKDGRMIFHVAILNFIWVSTFMCRWHSLSSWPTGILHSSGNLSYLSGRGGLSSGKMKFLVQFAIRHECKRPLHYFSI